jgi:hypothetical protein
VGVGGGRRAAASRGSRPDLAEHEAGEQDESRNTSADILCRLAYPTLICGANDVDLPVFASLPSAIHARARLEKVPERLWSAPAPGDRLSSPDLHGRNHIALWRFFGTEPDALRLDLLLRALAFSAVAAQVPMI